jgi:hypothetical protein
MSTAPWLKAGSDSGASSTAPWLTTYAALELLLPSPILYSLTVYWDWVRTSLAIYRAKPGAFPWAQYQDRGLLLYIVRIRGLALRHIQYRTYSQCSAAVRQDWRALKYVKPHDPLHASYHAMCRIAVKQNGLALLYVQEPSLQICLLALANAPAAERYVPSHILAQIQDMAPALSVSVSGY